MRKNIPMQGNLNVWNVLWHLKKRVNLKFTWKHTKRSINVIYVEDLSIPKPLYSSILWGIKKQAVKQWIPLRISTAQRDKLWLQSSEQFWNKLDTACKVIKVINGGVSVLTVPLTGYCTISLMYNKRLQ